MNPLLLVREMIDTDRVPKPWGGDLMASSTRTNAILFSRGRRWPAYALAVALPGAGHAYAGSWRRGFAWALLCGGALAFLSTGALLTEQRGLEPIVVTLFRLDVTTFADVAFPVTVLVLSVLDLYALAVLETTSYPPGEDDRA